MRSLVRRGAVAAFLALPLLAFPMAAAAAPAAPSSTCYKPVMPLTSDGGVEALIGEIGPATGSTVSAVSQVSFLYADKPRFVASSGRVTNRAITVNGATLTSRVTIGPHESGVPTTYADPKDCGSTSTDSEKPIPFSLPAADTDTVTVTASVHNSDGNHDTVSWSYTCPSPLTARPPSWPTPGSSCLWHARTAALPASRRSPSP